MARRNGDDDYLATRLRFPARIVSPLRNIMLRLGIALATLVIAAVLVYWQGDCYRDNNEMGGITWVDAFYYATVSLSTTGFGDITPVCDSARLVNTIVLTPLRFLFLIVLIGTTVEVLTQRSRQEFRAHRWRKRVNDHTIIVGFGVKGRAAARTLLDSGVSPKQIVIVAPDQASITDAGKMGLTAVMGDATREDILSEAEIQRASNVLIATDADDTAVLVTLTARRLAPHVHIVAAARETKNSAVLRQSGANAIVPTAESAGHLLGMNIVAPIAGELMEDLLETSRGLEVMQRAVVASEHGLVPSAIDRNGEIVLAVVRDGRMHRFDTSGFDVLRPGDEIVVIRHTGTD